MQLQIKLQVQIGLTMNVNDLLRMLTGKRATVRVQTWLAFLNMVWQWQCDYFDSQTDNVDIHYAVNKTSVGL